MSRTIADLKALREQLTEHRRQAAYAVADDLDGEGLDTSSDVQRSDPSIRRGN